MHFHYSPLRRPCQGSRVGETSWQKLKMIVMTGLLISYYSASEPNLSPAQLFPINGRSEALILTQHLCAHSFWCVWQREREREKVSDLLKKTSGKESEKRGNSTNFVTNIFLERRRDQGLLRFQQVPVAFPCSCGFVALSFFLFSGQ